MTGEQSHLTRLPPKQLHLERRKNNFLGPIGLAPNCDGWNLAGPIGLTLNLDLRMAFTKGKYNVEHVLEAREGWYMIGSIGSENLTPVPNRINSKTISQAKGMHSAK